MADLEVSFPKPCDEAWDAMSPRGCNRHCAACDTVVHDLAAMTFEEAEALLSREDETCVRAEIAPNGVLKLKPSGRDTGRRMVAAAGASLALATAACQTVPPAEEAPGFAISGAFNQYLVKSVTLYPGEGKSLSRKPDKKTGSVTFSGLAPGTYSLTINGDCGYYAFLENVTIVDRSVTVSEEAFTEESSNGCPIIVGRIRPVDRPELG
ncbi:MAG TPA: hypothetical protein VLA50_02410 [Erythrobacter sp.]|nr:hypothetical protein [Erythrobacter sp.]